MLISHHWQCILYAGFHNCCTWLPAAWLIRNGADLRNGTSETDLTHWGRVTHTCVGKLTIIGSDNGLSPGRRQAIIWTNAGILLIWPLGTNLSEILIEIDTFSFKKTNLKMSSRKWRPFCLGLKTDNVFPQPHSLVPGDTYLHHGTGLIANTLPEATMTLLLVALLIFKIY